jgi:hypothetical protein
MTPDRAVCGQEQHRERIERALAGVSHTRQHTAAIGTAELTAVWAGG